MTLIACGLVFSALPTQAATAGGIAKSTVGVIGGTLYGAFLGGPMRGGYRKGGDIVITAQPHVLNHVGRKSGNRNRYVLQTFFTFTGGNDDFFCGLCVNVERCGDRECKRAEERLDGRFNRDIQNESPRITS